MLMTAAVPRRRSLPLRVWAIALLVLASFAPAGAAVIAAGDRHALEIRGGQVYAWGREGYAVSDVWRPKLVALPANATPVSVAAGYQHSLALAANGQVYAWGSGSSGQLGNGSTGSQTPLPVNLPAGVGATAVAAGFGHSLAIGSDGRLYAWGQNTAGQLGDGSTTQRTSPVMVNLPAGVAPTAVAAGWGHSLAIGSNGQLYAWGEGSSGQLGVGSAVPQSTPVAVNLPAGVSALRVAAGHNFSMAIGSDGQLYSWGQNDRSQLGDGSSVRRNTPVAVSLPQGVTPLDMAGGSYLGFAVGSDGLLYGWGYNLDGGLGDGTITSTSPYTKPVPVPVSLPAGVSPVAVEAGSEFTIALGSDGKLYAWGKNSNGQLGDGSSVSRGDPRLVKMPSGVTAASFTAGYQSAAMGSDGRSYVWGGGTMKPTFFQPRPYASALSTVTGIGDPVAIGSDGRIYQALVGNFNHVRDLVLPPGVTPQRVMSVWGRQLAFGSDGNVYSWTVMDAGLTPPTINFGLPPGVAAAVVATGFGHAFFIGSDGQLYAKGNNTWGQLGDGTTVTRDTPVVITLAPGVLPVAVGGGSSHSVAIGSDGQLYVWGYNFNGQLGNGGSGSYYRASPLRLSLPGGVAPTALAVGADFSLVLGADGKVYGWGGNSAGQLGLGSLNDSDGLQPTAVRLPAGVPITAIAAGSGYGMARDASGRLFAWGANSAGQLGDDSATRRTAPHAIDSYAQVNDDFYGRTYLLNNSGQVIGSNVEATKELPEPDHAGRPTGGKSMWWKWRPTVSGTVMFSTAGSSFDTVLAVYTGSAVDALTLLAANDNAGDTSSYVALQVQAGVEYSVAVDSAAGATQPGGSIVLTYRMGQAQAITLPTVGTQRLGSGTLQPAATASSGLPVLLTGNTPAVCTVSGNNTIQLLRRGICTVLASQAGDATYLPAVVVPLSFEVLAAEQAITFVPIGDRELGSTLFVATASATSGLQVSFSSMTPEMCLMQAGNSVQLLAVGTCTLAAHQPGNANYDAAPDVLQSFNVAGPAGPGGGTGDGDVPLPGWALAMLGVTLMTVARRRAGRAGA